MTNYELKKRSMFSFVIRHALPDFQQHQIRPCHGNSGNSRCRADNRKYIPSLSEAQADPFHDSYGIFLCPCNENIFYRIPAFLTSSCASNFSTGNENNKMNFDSPALFSGLAHCIASTFPLPAGIPSGTSDSPRLSRLKA
jgi:hypothetical protein